MVTELDSSTAQSKPKTQAFAVTLYVEGKFSMETLHRGVTPLRVRQSCL
ncbi:MAG TPA: hypothetical protein V6D33_17820 [Cyanophyceae cyanobacterium]